MNKRSRLAALVGAGILTFAAVGAAVAVPPTYSINVTKTADPPTVPSGGASVTFTVWVENNGTGDLHTVDIVDSLAGCTVAFSAGDTNTNGILDSGETWSYTCTVAGVTPQTSNTATVNACHNNSDCNQQAHDAAGEGQVTVGLCESNCGPVITTGPGTSTGTSPGVSGQPTTDTLAPTGDSGPTSAAWLVIAALGVLLGSLVVLSPARIGKRR
jgi:uncharacterized repeat protein (TIGR01451 family)